MRKPVGKRLLPPATVGALPLDSTNWNLYERVQMRSGFPSRQRGEFRKARSLPGSVTSDSQRLVLDIPVPLRKRETRVELRATNPEAGEVGTHAPPCITPGTRRISSQGLSMFGVSRCCTAAHAVGWGRRGERAAGREARAEALSGTRSNGVLSKPRAEIETPRARASPS